jgi:4a-hydroxytetrahydrobiopterin dehydratase
VTKLDDQAISDQLAQLSGWSVDNNCLVKEFKFDDFKGAMRFINQLASAAEELNHHPDWSNSFNKVSLRLSTHSAGGITDKDFELAKKADQAANDL